MYAINMYENLESVYDRILEEDKIKNLAKGILPSYHNCL